jgi:predicted flavoprotein YhiN
MVSVVGGGAAGMMAAIIAARNGHKVHLYEKNEKLGKKYILQEREDVILQMLQIWNSYLQM